MTFKLHPFYIIKDYNDDTIAKFDLINNFMVESHSKFSSFIKNINIACFTQTFRVIQLSYDLIINNLKINPSYCDAIEFIIDAINLFERLSIFGLFKSLTTKNTNEKSEELKKVNSKLWLNICQNTCNESLIDGLETIIYFTIARHYYYAYKGICSYCSDIGSGDSLKGKIKIKINSECGECIQYFYSLVFMSQLHININKTNLKITDILEKLFQYQVALNKNGTSNNHGIIVPNRKNTTVLNSKLNENAHAIVQNPGGVARFKSRSQKEKELRYGVHI